MAKLNVYEIVTKQILNLLDEGTVPWAKPWRTTLHKNPATKHTYRGINQLLCEAYMMGNEDWTDPLWVTYKGAEKLGGNVVKDEKSNIVVYWKWNIEKDEETGEEKRTGGYYLYYRVFNVAQCENLELPEVEELELVPNEEAQRVIDEYEKSPKIVYGGNSAYYRPSADLVNVPKSKDFVDSDSFYAVNFHELIHSTGHKTRLERDGVMTIDEFGSESYSKEELIAELGCAMLCAQTGISPEQIERSASYLDSWRSKLSDEPKWIVQAASKAQKACEYMLKTEDA